MERQNKNNVLKVKQWKIAKKIVDEAQAYNQKHNLPGKINIKDFFNNISDASEDVLNLTLDFVRREIKKAEESNQTLIFEAK